MFWPINFAFKFVFSRHIQIPDVRSELKKNSQIFSFAMLMWSPIKYQTLIKMNSIYKLFIAHWFGEYLCGKSSIAAPLSLNLQRISTLLSVVVIHAHTCKICVFRQGLCNSIDLLRLNPKKKKNWQRKKTIAVLTLHSTVWSINQNR